MRKQLLKWSVLFSASLALGTLNAANYYMSPAGDDGNSGTLDEPFQSFAKAVTNLKPGDTLYLRAGRYTEQLNLQGLKGRAEKPIRFVAYNDEKVVFDGTQPIDGDWVEGENGVFHTKISFPIWQLFTGERPLDLGRWPNASINDGSVWDVHTAMRGTDRNWSNKLGKSDSVTQPGVIFDENHDGVEAGVNSQTLAETGIDFTGAVAVLNIGHWLTWARPILEHEAGSNQFTYNPKGMRMLKFMEYYIFGLQALDAEFEWWFDAKDSTVYVKPPKGKSPADLKLQGKARDFNLLADNCSYLSFSGVDFFATTFGFKNCNNMLVEDSQLLYPSTHKFMLGEYGWVSQKPPKGDGNTMTYIYNEGDGPFDNVVRDSSIEYPNSPAISLKSPGSILENCYIHNIEWDVNSSGGSGSLPGGHYTTVRNCTIHTTGGSEGIRLGSNSTIEGNRIFNTSLLQHDGSAINIGTSSQPGTVARRNWVYNTNRQAVRFDSTTSAYGSNAAVTENVFFDVSGGAGGNKFKGDYQLFAKNTAFDCFVAIPKGFGKTDDHNQHSLVRGNLVDNLVEWNMTNRAEGITAKMDHNISGSGVVRKLLRDPDNFDFRPKASSKELINAGKVVVREELAGDRIRLPEQAYESDAPDIGAYEFGAKEYWIPGCRIAQATSPVPPQDATAVKVDADLMWLQAKDAVSHNVYFRQADELSSAKQWSPVAKGVKGNIFTPAALKSGKSYVWRVDAVCEDGTLEQGDVWTFTVE